LPRAAVVGPAKVKAFKGGFAVVTAAGMIARTKGGTAAHLLGTGEYEVDFDGDVTRCGYVATLQDPGPGVGLDGTIGTATRSGNPARVFVLIHSSGTDAVTNANFVVSVVC